jgi:hypothetical protein
MRFIDLPPFVFWDALRPAKYIVEMADDFLVQTHGEQNWIHSTTPAPRARFFLGMHR